MKKIKKFSVLFFLICIISCTQKYNVVAEIAGIGNDTLFVESYKMSDFGEDPILDTIYAKDGKFFFNTKVNEPVITQIIAKKARHLMKSYKGIYNPEEKSILLLVKPDDKIAIKGSLYKTFLEYKAEGSAINVSISRFRNQFKEQRLEKTKLELKIDSFRANQINKDQINTLFKKRKEKINIIKKIQLSFIKENSNKDLAAYYLLFQPLDTLGNYYNNLNSIVKNGVFSNLLNAQLTNFKKYNTVKKAKSAIAIGKKAPVFSLQNDKGKLITVNYNLKKFTVLDFWGSWCAPCISGFPKMKQYYKKHKKNINFIGIACNDKDKNWKKAIKKYSLPWNNLINSKNLDNDVSTLFAVTDYPTKIIVNNSGKIVDIFEGEGKAFYKKIDELTKK